MKFGSYPFEANGGKKPIEWIILERYSDNTALLLSIYGLDAVRFDKNSNKWEESQIRQWLNNEFYNQAFSNADRSHILETQLQKTNDKIFLLSIEEAEKYFGINGEELLCQPTPYAQTDKTRTKNPVCANEKNNGSCWWWLRSAGKDNTHCTAAVVSLNGCIYREGVSVDMPYEAVRPALKINLNNL